MAFLIHFVGDVHQPLHAANNGDRGGNCVIVDSHPRAKDLHAAWDSTIVHRLEENAGTIEATARMLEQKYAGEKTQDAWMPGHTQDIAWESNQIARSDIYAALQIPVEPCETDASARLNGLLSTAQITTWANQEKYTSTGNSDADALRDIQKHPVRDTGRLSRQ